MPGSDHTAPTADIREAIAAALRAFTPGHSLPAARELLRVLGYASDRTLKLGGNPRELFAQYPSPSGKKEPTKSEKEFMEAAQFAHIVFQYTEEEIRASSQMTLLDMSAFERSWEQSFIFIAVELAPREYARGKYAAMTREISKRFAMPVCVLFVKDGLITLAFAHRRKSKRRGEDRDILGKVSLIREVNCARPHRAHLDILAELSLADRFRWIDENKKDKNFNGLLKAWQAVLDTVELNNRFYKELFAWFQWAVKDAKFPKREGRNKKMPKMAAEDHVIRLITRILFIWFIKEKNLVAEEFFREADVRSLLKDYDRDGGDDYYRAILQNLFFATLNTEIKKRGFSKDKPATHRNFNLWRYKKSLADPGELQRLMNQTPFINGGLFDCLDTEEGFGEGGYRLDCFTDHPPHQKLLSVPNRLFFDGERGLIPLLGKYKFTVEENTPIEQEVALDPELLGKVFENLLAAYNPETRGSARKQTGSYYTPRPIVEYMVSEALVVSLAAKVEPETGDAELFRRRLRYLLDFADAGEDLFPPREKLKIVRAISELKVLDPAAGSGAFPMGILHTLTLALGRLDPDNNIWKKLQLERAKNAASKSMGKPDKSERDKELLEISGTFDRYTGDFGRKLHLIQNSIFGVDIQPVACQIAKLRFFISLAIEQQPDYDAAAENFGIKPLPNLETRFVSADTLAGLRLSGVKVLRDRAIEKLEEQLRRNRERHFNARSRRKKLDYARKDKELRANLGAALKARYQSDSVWIAAWRIIKGGLAALRRELAKSAGKETAAWQDTLLPGESRESEQERNARRGKIRELRDKISIGEKLLAQALNREPAIKREEVWEQAEQMSQRQNKMIDEDAQKIADWDPYNQNTHAEWFDAEQMFGVTGGFDAVIGNPPYVQLQKDGGRLGDLYQKCDYEVFERTGDLYQLFYEFGMKALDGGPDKPEKPGVLAFITSNSWMRAKYGKKLRRFFSEQHRPLQLIDVGKDAFEAIVDTNILLVGRGASAPARSFKAVDMDAVSVEDFPPAEENWAAISPCGEAAWSILNSAAAAIKEKAEKIGTPLREWDVQIYRGVTIGYNKAFVIAQEKRDELIAADPKSAEILKPVLRGRNIRRYVYEWGNEWLINSHNGDANNAPINIDDYPEVKAHLLPYYAQLEQRQDQGNTPFNLRDCAYLSEFEKEKLIWIDLVDNGRFAYEPKKMFCTNSAFIMTGASIKYLCALLNSKMVTWIFDSIAASSGMGVSRWIRTYVEQIPVPPIPEPLQRPFVALVDKILAAKSDDPDADTSALEDEIDELVYQLYQLTPQEIAVIKGSRAQS